MPTLHYLRGSIIYSLIFSQFHQALREGYSSNRQGEYLKVRRMLLEGGIDKILTERDITWDASLCRGDPEYLSRLEQTGAFYSMFSASPGSTFVCL